MADQYKLKGFKGTPRHRPYPHGDRIRCRHPLGASLSGPIPFADVSVVHNGQLTNYWTGRRALERKGHRFMSNCDSELIAVYLADKMQQGAELEGRDDAIPSTSSTACSPMSSPPPTASAWPRT